MPINSSLYYQDEVDIFCNSLPSYHEGSGKKGKVVPVLN